MQANPPSNQDLPAELSTKPLALVGISGLDTLNNAIHKLIWEAFNSLKRTDKTCVSYKLIENDHEFPVIKPKRNSYDWYIPKGILKKNWMKKYLYEIPAVIAIFYDLDWNEQSWSEKMIECASRVQSMRAALDGRNSRIVLVLIQNVSPLPSSEDVQATERAVSICASCELQSNSLFVLPQGDHLHGYTLRLENAFFEFAQIFYHNEIRTIKSHKEHLNKNNHQCLFVRHQFKLGFLYELKQDIHTAHKHYTHAYNSLLEIRIVDTNALEIRTVAGFINYKLCKLLFVLNLPRDAIAHFRSHIEKFKQRIGFQELAFEHCAWLSKQYSVFGDVFDSAVKLGVSPVQTQHPGIYYQQSAEYATLRKNVARELCLNVTAYPQPDPFEGTQHPDYFGQRPWRVSKSTIDPLDPDIELKGIQALQYLEMQVNHSSIIISLYGLAIQQFKIYKCPRTRRYLVLQMAEEYYKSGDYGKCLTLLTHMLYDLRMEKWWKLLSDILAKALKCAYLTANVPDYLSLAFELLGKNTLQSFEEKKLIYENIERVLKIQIPYSDITLEPDVLQNTIIQWQSAYSKIPLNVNLEVVNVSCIEARAKFTKLSYVMDEEVIVKIFVKNVSPFLLSFRSLSVIVSALPISLDLPVVGELLDFNPGVTTEFVVKFLPQCEYVDKTLQIISVNLTTGDPSLCNLDLKLMNINSMYDNGICPELQHFRYNGTITDHDFVAFSQTQILPRVSRLEMKIEHPDPALEGEWYQITIKITSEETEPLQNFKLEMNLGAKNMLDDVEFAVKPDESCSKLPMVIYENNLLKDTEIDLKFYMRINRATKRYKPEDQPTEYYDYTIDISAAYSISVDPVVICLKKESTTVNTLKPFEITQEFHSGLMGETTSFYTGEVFVFSPSIESLSPWSIDIVDAKLELSYLVQPIDDDTDSKIKNMTIGKGEVVTDFYPLICNQCSEQNIQVGTYVIKWRRENGILATKELKITGYPVEYVPIHFNATISSHGIVRNPLLITYNIQNVSNELIQMNLSMEASDAFMYAGYKQTPISVTPQSTNSISFNLYPLITGRVTLPKVVLKIDDPICGSFKQEDLDKLMEWSLPSFIYIMPQVKGHPKVIDMSDENLKEYYRDCEEIDECYEVNSDGELEVRKVQTVVVEADSEEVVDV